MGLWLVMLCNTHLACPCSVVDPTITVEVTPSASTLLDVTPHNLIFIDCSVTQPLAVTTSKTIGWRQTSPSGVVQSLNHDGVDTNITMTGLNDSASTSQLSVYATVAGHWRYTCSANLQVPGDPVISYSQTAAVIIKGW